MSPNQRVQVTSLRAEPDPRRLARKDRPMKQDSQPSNAERHQFTTFADARRIVEQFEDDLRSLGITISNGSELELICAYVMDLESQKNGESTVTVNSDVRPLWRRAVGLMSLLDMLNHARQRNQLSVFAPHLRILNAGSVSQNIRTSLTDDTCNKVFEMLIALLCLPIAEDVVLDHPQSSKGDNPDVLAKIDGTLWGFSCKTPQGTSPKSLFDRLKEGVDQIENSPAQKGVVYFNFRNIIDHDAVWPEVLRETLPSDAPFTFRVWPDSSLVNEYYRNLVDAKNAEMLNAIGAPFVQAIFKDKKSLPGAMVYLQSAAAFKTEHGQTIMSISFPAMMEFGTIPDQDYEVIRRILRGITGTDK